MHDEDRTKQQLIKELEQLRQQVTDQRQINSNLPVLVATAGFDGYYKDVNAAFERILGWSKKDSLSRPFIEFIHPDDHAAATETFGRLESGEVAINFVDRNLCKDGSCRWISWVVIPVSGRDIVFGIGQDITEQKLAEEALMKAHDELEQEVANRTTELRDVNAQLQQSCDELQTIYNGMVDGLLVTDIETLGFLRVNTAICKMLGYSETELLSLSARDLHPPEAIPHIVERIRSVIEGAHQTSPGTVPFLRKDRSVFHAEVIGKFLLYDGRPCSMAIFRDITERRRAEEVLQQHHNELQAIYEQAVEGIVIIDIETVNPVRANPALCELLGYSEKEVYSLSPTVLQPPELLSTVKEYLDAAKEAITRIDALPFLRKDGSTVYADLVTGPIRYDNRPCWICSFHDVTERKKAEEALERERQSLWNMLQASDHERQVIAYDIHDGLAQYLAAADMQFQVHDSSKENSPAHAGKAYQTALELVRQAHAESRRLISEVRHPVIDERGIETAITSLAYEQRQRGGPRIQCQTSVDFDRLPAILENALYRMAQEALANACKHSKSKKVTVSLIQEGPEVLLEVQDDGIGFDTKTVPEDRFGLESIRQRVRLLDGRLTIESKPDSGTLVRVMLPIVEKQGEE